jgi:hypothetical protein
MSVQEARRGDMTNVNYTGYIDRVSTECIIGWCKPAESSTPRAVVEIYEGETLIASTLADQFRQDLLILGGDGYHAFRCPLPGSLGDGAVHFVRICAGPDRQPLTPLPIEISPPEGTQNGAGAMRRLEAGDLPVIAAMPNALRRGRNVYEGYQRSIGIIGGLRKWIAEDPDYIEAARMMANRSIIAQDKAYNIFLLIKFYLPKLPFGHIVEFGSYRGGSAFFMGSLARKFLPGTLIYSLDTFEGMPLTDKTVDAHNSRDFNTTSLAEIERARAEFGLDNVKFVQGLFSETATDILKAAKSIRLAHIDCDIYESVLYAYSVVKPYMVPTGYYVFDDSTEATCMGATEVVEDIVIRRDGLLSEQIFPHHVFRWIAESGNPAG